MKKHPRMEKKYIFPCVLLTLVLTACGGNAERAQVENLPTEDTYVSSSYVTGYAAPSVEKESVETSEKEAETAPSWYTEDAILDAMTQQEGRYHYDKMQPSLHRLYAEIYLILMNQGEKVIISTHSADELSYAFQCVYNDHPEIFWIDGYKYIRRTHGSREYDFAFTGNYIYDLTEVASFQFQISNYVSRATVGLQLASDYEKVKHVYEYVITHTEYKLSSKDNQTILSTMLYGESVCQGYAKTVQYLLNYLDVPTTMVIGTNGDGEGHAWNLACVDGSYYYIDATWGDASYGSNRIFGSNQPSINYDYLNITTQELGINHNINAIVPLPMCVAMESNYYVKEGLYFTSYSGAAINMAFENAYNRREKYITLKASDASVYESMRYELLERQAIFGYLRGRDTVTYMENPINLTLTFWL